MGIHRGPNPVNDGLVFGYDTGYGVADNNTATRFYPGEPTTNYADDTVDAQGGWGGSYSLIDSATKKFRFNVNNFAANPGAGWRCFVWDMRAHAGSAVTISATVEVPDDSPGDFAWIMIGQSSSGSNGTSSANYHGYSAASERYQKSTKNTERITWSGTIGNTGTANQPNGYIGFTIWYNGGTPGTNSYVDISNIQIEKISHATPFVDGTRSDTASLIDLKRTTNIDVANVSFDSTGQPIFDGTNDHITGVLSINGNGSPHTIEMVFSSNVNQGSLGGRKDPFTIGNSTTHQYSALDVNTTNMNWYFYSKDTTFTNSPQMVANQYYHIVLSYAGGYSNNTNKKVWINGIQQTLSAGVNETPLLPNNPSFSVGRDRGRNTAYWPGKVPVFKVYDRALTQEEAQQNYKAYKNRFNL